MRVNLIEVRQALVKVTLGSFYHLKSLAIPANFPTGEYVCVPGSKKPGTRMAKAKAVMDAGQLCF